MIDAEVMRLRQLRDTALRARAMARTLRGSGQPRNGHDGGGHGPLFTRAALQCWQIARLITGTLRAHPYPPFQKDINPAAAVAIALSTLASGTSKKYRGLELQALDDQLLRVARRLADARALTWHQGLSDVLGRLQGRLVILSNEVAEAARVDAEAHGREVSASLRMSSTLSPAYASAGPVHATTSPTTAAPSLPQAFDETWPYLAL